MNNTKIELSKLNQDYDSYVLSEQDKKRIKGLKIVTESNELSFKYFITISPYSFIADNDYGRKYVSEENLFLRTKIRRFFKSDIKFWFFTEKYSDASSKHYGGLHRHILMEDLSSYRWKNPTNSMINFYEKFAPEAIFSPKFGEEVSEIHKIELIKRVCRLCNQTPNGKSGLDIRTIHNQEKLLGYCTKQIKTENDISAVVDFANSDYLNNPTRKTNETFIKFPFVGRNPIPAGVN